MIKRLLNKSTEVADDRESLPSGRLVTSLDVPADRNARLELSEADVERIAARVADRLRESPLTEPIAKIVAEVAERLVREEIARMRAAANRSADGAPTRR